MNTTTIVSILGSGVFGATLLGLYDRIKNRKYDAKKQTTGIKLDEAQYAEIATRAAQVNDTNLMAVGSFWQGQFREVTKEIDSLKEWRAKAKERFRAHAAWDRAMVAELESKGHQVDPPPDLDPDE